MDPVTERIDAFPWDALPFVTRDEIVSRRQAIDHFPAFADVERVGRALSERLGVRCDIAPLTVGIGLLPPLPQGVAVEMREPSPSADSVMLELDLSLVLAMIARVTQSKEPSVLRPDGEASPRLCGAAAAIATSVARRVFADTSSLFLAERATPSASLSSWLAETADPIHAAYSVIVGEEAHLARVWLRAPRPFASLSFASFGRAPIALKVVLHEAVIATAEVASLAPSDVLVLTAVPATGAWPVTLATPAAECGFRCTLDMNRSALTYLGEIVDLDPASRLEHSSMPNERVLEDVPVTVRVEVGSVELAAREWARLRAGDTLALGRRLGEPVVLRVSGVEVARGELVNVEGEVGVRILEKHPAGSETVDTQVVPS